jgi:predicted nucleotidyltransferase
VISLRDALARIAADLDAEGKPWALVGALAVAARAEARATLDVDAAVAVESPEESRALVASLRERGYRWERDLGSSMTTLAVPGSEEPRWRLDLLFGLAGIEDAVARAAERLEVLPGLEMPVARRGDLIALKLLAAGQPGREHDWRDLRALCNGATAEDLQRAHRSVALLVARGLAPEGTLEARLRDLVTRS